MQILQCGYDVCCVDCLQQIASGIVDVIVFSYLLNPALCDSSCNLVIVSFELLVHTLY